MPMCGERLAAAMSRAVPVSIAGAMPAAITVAVTLVIQWRAALLWRRALRQLPQPDGAGTNLTTAAATTAAVGTLPASASRGTTVFMAPAALTALLPTPAITVATHIAATSPGGRRCSRATTAAWALATALMPLTVASPLNRGITMFMAPAGITALLPTPATVAT